MASSENAAPPSTATAAHASGSGSNTSTRRRYVNQITSTRMALVRPKALNRGGTISVAR